METEEEGWSFPVSVCLIVHGRLLLMISSKCTRECAEEQVLSPPTYPPKSGEVVQEVEGVWTTPLLL